VALDTKSSRHLREIALNTVLATLLLIANAAGNVRTRPVRRPEPER
jgi:hypothetical protein